MSGPGLNMPVELVTSAPVAEVGGGGEWPLIIAVIGAIIFTLVTLHLWLRTRGDGDADEAAFRELSSRLRLSREQKRLVRELSEAHPKATPSAMLLSTSALLEGAVLLNERTGDRTAEVKSLLSTLGVGAELPETPPGERERLELIA